MAERQAYWENVYATKATDSVSWFQRSAGTSLAMIRAAAVAHDAAIIDIGGGASVLLDELFAAGFRDITVLDIAESALAASKTRLGPRAKDVHWIVADILSWKPERSYDLWHDRAVFHFLTAAGERAVYRATLEQALRPGGWLIIGTFAPEGPQRCSGLPVQRWSPDALAAELGAGFQLAASTREEHRTPGGAVQTFTWCRFRRA